MSDKQSMIYPDWNGTSHLLKPGATAFKDNMEKWGPYLNQTLTNPKKGPEIPSDFVENLMREVAKLGTEATHVTPVGTGATDDPKELATRLGINERCGEEVLKAMSGLVSILTNPNVSISSLEIAALTIRGAIKNHQCLP